MKRIGILLCCIVLCLLFPEKVHAEEIVSEKEPVDIIFVIDCSGSMKTNDVSRIFITGIPFITAKRARRRSMNTITGF